MTTYYFCEWYIRYMSGSKDFCAYQTSSRTDIWHTYRRGGWKTAIHNELWTKSVSEPISFGERAVIVTSKQEIPFEISPPIPASA